MVGIIIDNRCPFDSTQMLPTSAYAFNLALGVILGRYITSTKVRYGKIGGSVECIVLTGY